MSDTTIKIHQETKTQLDLFREYENESYDEVIRKMIFIANSIKKQPKLSLETVEAIEKARERIKSGNFICKDAARRRLGL